MAWRVANVVARPPVFDRDILALDVAGLAQAIAEHRREISVNIRVARMEKSNYGQRRLLRARRERPRDCRAAEQRDERAARHSITSSARSSSVAGTSGPGALAVLGLRPGWGLGGAAPGRPAGFSPLGMGPT